MKMTFFTIICVPRYICKRQEKQSSWANDAFSASLSGVSFVSCDFFCYHFINSDRKFQTSRLKTNDLLLRALKKLNTMFSLLLHFQAPHKGNWRLSSL